MQSVATRFDMQGLYPIIRRVRRPLTVQTEQQTPAALPPVAVPLVQSEEVVSNTPPKQEKRNDGRDKKKRT